MMTAEDWMGFLLFMFGLFLIILCFFAVLDIVTIISGLMIVGFSILGFILCVTGYLMARSTVHTVMRRFRS